MKEIVLESQTIARLQELAGINEGFGDKLKKGIAAAAVVAGMGGEAGNLMKARSDQNNTPLAQAPSGYRSENVVDLRSPEASREHEKVQKFIHFMYDNADDISRLKRAWIKWKVQNDAELLKVQMNVPDAWAYKPEVMNDLLIYAEKGDREKYLELLDALATLPTYGKVFSKNKSAERVE